MYKSLQPLLLASASPRRKAFFDILGLDYSLQAAAIDEFVQPGEKTFDFVARMAEEKAEDVAREKPASWIIAADTIVCLADKILGKPGSSEHAVEMLCQLSGNEHKVMSSFCLLNKALGIKKVEVVQTIVVFSNFSRKTALDYVETGEPLDKAGAYAIQGLGGSLVKRIEGSYSNVVGLPLVELISCLKKQSLIE